MVSVIKNSEDGAQLPRSNKVCCNVLVLRGVGARGDGVFEQGGVGR